MTKIVLVHNVENVILRVVSIVEHYKIRYYNVYVRDRRLKAVVEMLVGVCALPHTRTS